MVTSIGLLYLVKIRMIKYNNQKIYDSHKFQRRFEIVALLKNGNVDLLCLIAKVRLSNENATIAVFGDGRKLEKGKAKMEALVGLFLIASIPFGI